MSLMRARNSSCVISPAIYNARHAPQNSPMPTLVSWIRLKDERYFAHFCERVPNLSVSNAARGDTDFANADALLLTGGADVAPQFLRQPVDDTSEMQLENDPLRDQWEFDAVHDALARDVPILAICKGMQLLNVALGGTLLLDVPGHNSPEMKDNDVQQLRTSSSAVHRFECVNSSHHQSVDRVADGFEVEAWSAKDDVIEQM